MPFQVKLDVPEEGLSSFQVKIARGTVAVVNTVGNDTWICTGEGEFVACAGTGDTTLMITAIPVDKPGAQPATSIQLTVIEPDNTITIKNVRIEQGGPRQD